MHGHVSGGQYEKKILVNKLFLRRRFFTTMMGEGDDMLDQINILKTLKDHLGAVGAPLSGDDLATTLLASLSKSYQFLITALELRADSLTLELVKSWLLNEDMERKEQGGGIGEPRTVKLKQSCLVTTSARIYQRRRPVRAKIVENKKLDCRTPSQIQEDAERHQFQRASIAQ